MKTSGPLSEQSNLSSAGDQTGGSIRESVPEQPYESKAQSQCPEIRSKASKGISTKYKTRQAKETIENDNQGDDIDDNVIDKLYHLGINAFVPQDQVGGVFENGVPSDERIRLAPLKYESKILA
uniref:Uncharacterized protein n=1 Tax=Trichogramma kaykai TaxID=54128 RepID=A0ABD2WNJ3_9HYME